MGDCFFAWKPPRLFVFYWYATAVWCAVLRELNLMERNEHDIHIAKCVGNSGFIKVNFLYFSIYIY